MRFKFLWLSFYHVNILFEEWAPTLQRNKKWNVKQGSLSASGLRVNAIFSLSANLQCWKKKCNRKCLLSVALRFYFYYYWRGQCCWMAVQNRGGAKKDATLKQKIWMHKICVDCFMPCGSFTQHLVQNLVPLLIYSKEITIIIIKKNIILGHSRSKMITNLLVSLFILFC